MGRRGVNLILLGAALGALLLAVPPLVDGPAATPVAAPEPVTPTGRGPAAPPATSTSPSPSPGPSLAPSPDPGPTASTPSSGPPARPTPSRPSAPRSSPSAPPAGKAAGFRAVAGPACPVDAAQRTRVSAGWQVVPGDSWTGDGCGDRFLYSPPDDPNYLQWLFTFETASARTCRIEVFVPDSPLASARVWYGVADRFENVDYRVGGFTVDQKANRGRWVKAATVAVGTGTLLVNVDGDQGNAGVAGGPLRVTCAGSAM